eukprot:COSAG01_NODE_7943_length_2980_cov_4.422623_2_plen_39_part_00
MCETAKQGLGLMCVGLMRGVGLQIERGPELTTITVSYM